MLDYGVTSDNQQIDRMLLGALALFLALINAASISKPQLLVPFLPIKSLNLSSVQDTNAM